MLEQQRGAVDSGYGYRRIQCARAINHFTLSNSMTAMVAIITVATASGVTKEEPSSSATKTYGRAPSLTQAAQRLRFRIIPNGTTAKRNRIDAISRCISPGLLQMNTEVKPRSWRKTKQQVSKSLNHQIPRFLVFHSETRPCQSQCEPDPCAFLECTGVASPALISAFQYGDPAYWNDRAVRDLAR